MRIIFQDIDGPLIPLRMYFSGNRPFANDPGSFVYDPVAVAMINHLCEQFGAKVVFNTAHNENPPEIMFKQGHFNGFKHLHDDIQTDYETLISAGRHSSIKKWLEKHPEVTEWIVIDDVLVYEPRQILVDYTLGMTLKDFHDSQRLFGYNPSPIIGVGQAIGLNKTH